MKKGRLFVFEGIDGSGKGTQTKLLLRRLKKEGLRTRFFDFPQYGKKSAGLVQEYLAGTYGSALEVGPHRASVFYAVDRYDASFAIKQLLRKGITVVADRYVGSNMGHQGGKIKNRKKRERFFRWLHDFEYSLFSVPKPTVSIFLSLPLRFSEKLREADKTRRAKDLHERDLQHLKDAYQAYQHALKLFPRDFLVIECVEKGVLLPPGEIHDRIWKKLQRYL